MRAVYLVQFDLFAPPSTEPPNGLGLPPTNSTDRQCQCTTPAGKLSSSNDWTALFVVSLNSRWTQSLICSTAIMPRAPSANLLSVHFVPKQVASTTRLQGNRIHHRASRGRP